MQVSQGAELGEGEWNKSGYRRLQVCAEMDWCWLGSGVPAISRTRDQEKKKRKKVDDW